MRYNVAFFGKDEGVLFRIMGEERLFCFNEAMTYATVGSVSHTAEIIPLRAFEESKGDRGKVNA